MRVWAVLFAAFFFGATAALAFTGIVVVDEAQVYEQPDLDAPVIGLLRAGSKISISKGTRGDYAKFHKTKVNGKIGWISALDVRTETGKKTVNVSPKAAKGPFAAKEQKESKRRERKGEHTPLAFSRAVGLTFGASEYAEDVGGQERRTNLVTYGLKMSGPDVFFEGPLIDANITFHYGAPDYYSSLSSVPPQGFLMWMDANLLMPFYMRDNSLIGVAAGPVLILSSIQASQGSTAYNMFQLNAGVNVELTAGLRFGDFAIRLDGKYVFEKKTYKQAQLAIQSVF